MGKRKKAKEKKKRHTQSTFFFSAKKPEISLTKKKKKALLKCVQSKAKTDCVWLQHKKEPFFFSRKEKKPLCVVKHKSRKGKK
jgi:hypothetical protein